MPQVGFEPTISAGERPQTYASLYITETNYVGSVNTVSRAVEICRCAEFGKLRTTAIVPSRVRPYVRPHGTSRLPLDGFALNFIFGGLNQRLLRKIKVD